MAKADFLPPVTVPYAWKTVTIGGGGYVTDVYCHPKVKDLVYIRTDVGGFYRWNSKDDSWIPLTDGFRREQSNYYGGEGLALDPAHPDVVYIAAGKYGWSSLPGTIFKSADRGRSWKKLPIDLKMGGNEDHRWGGPRLMVSPFHPDILLFGSRHDGLWRSNNAGTSWQRVTGLSAKLSDGVGVNAIAFSEQKPGSVFASVFGDAVYRSGDDGLTWERTENSPTDIQRLAPAKDGTIYASHSKGVGKLRDGIWQNITPPEVKDGFGGISVNPQDSADIVVTAQSDNLQLFHSKDAGGHWTRQKTETKSSAPWYSGSMRRIQYVAGLSFDPVVTGRLWLTDWYATYRTENINAETALFSNFEHGHEELVIFSLAAPPTGLPLLSGVADVDGFPHTDLDAFPEHGIGNYYGGTGPTFGDCYQIIWCPSRPTNLARVGGRRWNGTGGGAISRDGGKTWSSFASWDEKTVPVRIALSATDAQNMVVLRMGTATPLVTHDGGKTWKNISGLPVGFVSDPWNWSSPLVGDGGKAGIFYCVKDGTVFRSVDGGDSFAPVSTLPVHGQVNLQSVPGFANELYVSAGDGGLFYSSNGGLDFQKVTSVEHSSLFAVGKPAPGSMRPALYLYGTLTGAKEPSNEGIYRSIDGGNHWVSIQDSLCPVGDEPNCMTASWKTYGLVFIGTNGRGIYAGAPKPKGLR